MKLGAVAIRGLAGSLFIGHGTQKLLGWFGGHGIEGTSGFMESLRLRPGRRHALAAGTAETTGGTLLVLGAFTPLATTLLSSTMITAIRKVHAKNGPWNERGGFEYNAVLIATLTALAENGPGPLSVDSARFPRLRGVRWAALSLATAAAGSFLATSPVMSEAPQPEPAAPMPSTDGQRKPEPVGVA
jgi:putative oxidoreductase